MKLIKKAYFLIGILFFGCFAGPVCYYESKLDQCNETIKEQKEQMALLKDYYNESVSQQEKYQELYTSAQKDNEYLIKKVEELQKWRALGQFVITYYWPGEDRYGKLTSTGAIAKEGKTIAVDPSVIPYGSTVLIDGKEYLAQDCGGDIKGNKIDVFVESPKLQKYQVEIYIKREWWIWQSKN